MQPIIRYQEYLGHPKKPQSLACFGSAFWDSTIVVSDEDLEKFALTKGISQYRAMDEQREILSQLNPSSGDSGACSSTIKISSPGGTSCNLVRHLAPFDVDVSFSTILGPDESGRQIRDALSALPSLRHHIIESQTGKSTGHITVLVTPDGERTMLVDMGVNIEMTKESLRSRDIMQAQVYHVCGYQWDSMVQRKLVKDAIALSASCGGIISLDVADPEVVARNKQDFLDLIQGGDIGIVFANHTEACALFGEDYKKQILARCDDVIYVFKLGAQGAVVIHRGSENDVEPRGGIKVCDTTGAGDVLAGGFFAGYLKGCSLLKCLQLGNHLAGDVVTRWGVQASDQAFREGRELLAS